MPSILGKNFNYLCFTKLKPQFLLPPPPPPLPPAPPPPQSSRNPNDHHNNDDHNRPLPSILMIKNFNTLYDSSTTSITATTSGISDSDSDDTTTDETTPDFATIYASHRFFFSSPGRSNSIIDSSSSLTSSSTSISSSLPEIPPESDPLFKKSIAVQTYSPDPYSDFRRSMQEMVEARELMDVEANWEYLHELLLCYLALNPKNTHKFIVGAFADLLVSLMSATTECGDRKTDNSGGSCSVERRFM